MHLSRIGPLVALLSCLAGCGVELCQSETAPAPFQPVIGDFPSEAVFCATTMEDNGFERVDFPAPGQPWPDGLLPNSAHLNFALESPHDAWVELVDQFESKGWERIDQSSGDRLAVTFARSDGYVLDFSVINSNSSSNPLKKDRVHAYLEIRQAPCDTFAGSHGAACREDTLVTCTNGVITDEVDCAANQQSCGADHQKAACVSDLCLAGKLGAGTWSAEACPPELTGP